MFGEIFQKAVSHLGGPGGESVQAFTIFAPQSPFPVTALISRRMWSKEAAAHCRSHLV